MAPIAYKGPLGKEPGFAERRKPPEASPTRPTLVAAEKASPEHLTGDHWKALDRSADCQGWLCAWRWALFWAVAWLAVWWRVLEALKVHPGHFQPHRGRPMIHASSHRRHGRLQGHMLCLSLEMS